MAAMPDRGDVWLVDLGLAAKVRPCLVVSIRNESNDRTLVTLVPHTTSARGSRFEVVVPKNFLKSGAFDVQGIVTVAEARLIRKLGRLERGEIEGVEQRLKLWLGLS